jgi:hypothetical protein
VLENNILDEEIGQDPKNRISWFFWFLGAIFMVGVCLEAVSVYHIFQSEVMSTNTSIIRCFYNPYPYRPFVEYVYNIGILSSFIYVAIEKWTFPELSLKRIILLGPLLIYLIDRILLFIIE